MTPTGTTVHPGAVETGPVFINGTSRAEKPELTTQQIFIDATIAL